MSSPHRGFELPCLMPDKEHHKSFVCPRNLHLHKRKFILALFESLYWKRTERVILISAGSLPNYLQWADLSQFESRSQKCCFHVYGIRCRGPSNWTVLWCYQARSRELGWIKCPYGIPVALMLPLLKKKKFVNVLLIS